MTLRAGLLLSASLLAAGYSMAHAEEQPAAPIGFNRHVRPILSNNCFRCHGPDGAARQGELRLDRREDAVARGAIVPGDVEASLLLRRVLATDDSQMPPPDSGQTLTPAERQTLRQWITQGAAYEPHWAWTPPRPVDPPAISRSDLANNAIDHFVIADLDRRGLSPAPPADPATLLRRVSLALTGLPPTIAEVDAFLADPRPDAYERAVDRLLDSPRYGERMAADWLDAARYADTNGYFGDNPRQMWPWRDWVIAAFNRNLPYDQFTVEQLAGDLLPGATLEQQVATGFNRNHMVTDETGIIDEEYRVEYMADRLETTGAVWLGLTVGCARCHDHKYDPLTQRQYYELFAYFNNGPETGLASLHDPPPTLELATAEQRAELDMRAAARAKAEAELVRVGESLGESIASWELAAADELSPPADALAAHVAFEPERSNTAESSTAAGLPAAVERGSSLAHEPGVVGQAALFDAQGHLELPPHVLPDTDGPWTIGLWIKPTGSLNCILSKTEPTEERRGIEVLWRKGRIRVHLVQQWGVAAIEVETLEPAAKSDWRHVVVRHDGSGQAAGIAVFIDGAAADLNVERDALAGAADRSIDNDQPLAIGRRDNGLGYYGHIDELRVYGRALSDDEIARLHSSDRIGGILSLPADGRDTARHAIVRDYYIRRHGDPAARTALDQVTHTRAAEAAQRALLPTTLVMQDLPQPRQTYVLLRGQYDQPGDAVQPSVPDWLSPAILTRSVSKGTEVTRSVSEGSPDTTAYAAVPAPPRPDRLALARWLTAPDHPLTARVAVNRLWRQCFGEGLVRTANDFGSQGEPPTHPELLNWLAVRFVAGGWDMKDLLRLIVTSATFRQSSIPRDSLLADDPDNRRLARGPRFRLPAEMIRDQALFASSLLAERVGGPSVKPYQPPGLWEEVSYDGDASYVPDQGEGRWRRSLYTYWKRQAPPPALLIFDAPTRETCSVLRARTNTPAQALVLLNDPMHVEAARGLAADVLDIAAADGQRLSHAFRRVTSRPPDDTERDVLLSLLDRQRNRFAADPSAARRFVDAAAVPPALADTASDDDRAIADWAAWTAVAQVILNLDETLTSR
jgi:hypothetical protein